MLVSKWCMAKAAHRAVIGTSPGHKTRPKFPALSQGSARNKPYRRTLNFVSNVHPGSDSEHSSEDVLMAKKD